MLLEILVDNMCNVIGSLKYMRYGGCCGLSNSTKIGIATDSIFYQKSIRFAVSIMQIMANSRLCEIRSLSVLDVI